MDPNAIAGEVPENHGPGQAPGQEPLEESRDKVVAVEPEQATTLASFPIVGIGASAGGLAAIEAFFAAMPSDTESGMAFVVVQHLAPDRKSLLNDLVKTYTRMQVLKVEEAIEVQPNCVYIIPPGQDMAFLNGRLHLQEPGAPHGLRLPIDFFFRSLANDQHERAIGIVLSGTGTDGTLGLKAIKGEGGMTMAQTPESAAYDGMPRSAISTGQVDFILPPDKMPEQLIAFAKHAFGPRPKPTEVLKADELLQKVLVLLRTQQGHDFSGYKQNSIRRRIEHRMAVTQISRLEDYFRYLRGNNQEIEALFHELLIGVTSFFRDPDAFAALQAQVLPGLFAQHAGESVRIWVPGCATGEEAYSLAMLTRDYLDETRQTARVQIFATDLDDEAVDKARGGSYPDSIAADVSPERLARHFVQTDDFYRVSKSIRDMVVFATQDVLKDPPFSRMDLISCRNLFIYLGSAAQKQLLQLFHYALNRDGYLFLGSSETIGDALDLYGEVDKKWRIYQRRGAKTPYANLASSWPPRQATAPSAATGRAAPAPGGTRELTERVLLENYAPASVLINAEHEVLYVHGRTGKYLEPAAGEASLNLLRMARQGLRLPLAAGVRQALTRQTTVRYERLEIESGPGEAYILNLIVQPLARQDLDRHGLLLIIFEDVPPAPRVAETVPVAIEGDPLRRVAQLERELHTKTEYLQTIIEELQTSSEELKSTNEELQSANEELQSTNEEMSTSKEEQQSVNEELVTVNTELQHKILLLGQVNNDMNNLLASTGIGTLFVDHALKIRRFTPATTRVISLIQTDVGRPVSDIVSRFQGYDRLTADIREVLDTLVPKDLEVQHVDGEWYQLRIQPYRTLEDVIEGAVLTFVDVTRQRQLHIALQESQERLASLFELLPVGVCVLEADGLIAYVNPALAAISGVAWEDLIGSAHAGRRYLRPDGTPMPAEEVASTQALAGQRAVHHVETGILKEDGTVIWTDMSAMPLALAGWRMVVVTFDLSGHHTGATVEVAG